MTKEPKKGFFSFGKKKKEESEGKKKEGFFSRFKKKKDEPTPEPVAPTGTEEHPDMVDAAREQSAPMPSAPEIVENQASVGTGLADAEPVSVAQEPEPTTSVTAVPEPEATVESVPVENPPVEQEQAADIEQTGETDAEEAEESGEEKKGFFSRFGRKNKEKEGDDEEADVVDGEEGEKKPRFRFLSKLKNGLQRTRESLKGKLGNLFLATRKIDEDLLEEIEELLIGSDLGVQTTMDIIEKIRREVDRKTLKNGEELKEQIKIELMTLLNDIPRKSLALENNPAIILIVGVNGVGKTTTIGKVANQMAKDGKKVVVCAADTLRAAAVEQLEIWAGRAGVDIVLKKDAKDPATVVYDALDRVDETNADVLLIDTAGRLHNNPNLMNELNKIYRIIQKRYDNAPHHVLLILDAVTGQNGLMQARQFVDKAGGHRPDRHQTGWDGQGRYCHCHRPRTEHAHPIHWGWGTDG